MTEIEYPLYYEDFEVDYKPPKLQEINTCRLKLCDYSIRDSMRVESRRPITFKGGVEYSCDLIEDIMLELLAKEYLDPEVLLTLGSTSKFFYNAINDNRYWNRHMYLVKCHPAYPSLKSKHIPNRQIYSYLSFSYSLSAEAVEALERLENDYVDDSRSVLMKREDKSIVEEFCVRYVGQPAWHMHRNHITLKRGMFKLLIVYQYRLITCSRIRKSSKSIFCLYNWGIICTI